MVIMKATRHQINELWNKIAPQNRRVFSEITITNLYDQMSNTMFVASDDVTFAEFPEKEVITLGGAHRVATMAKAFQELRSEP